MYRSGSSWDLFAALDERLSAGLHPWLGKFVAETLPGMEQECDWMVGWRDGVPSRLPPLTECFFLFVCFDLRNDRNSSGGEMARLSRRVGDM